ncbi:hypothetical protein L1887_60488 [Cichorium endivia]|nr:hypothetical protein L1887_60488 [Cichorium endivia]
MVKMRFELHLELEHLVLEHVCIRLAAAACTRSSGVAARARRRIKEGAVFGDGVADGLDLVQFVCLGEQIVAGGEEFADGGEEACAVFLGERGAKRVDGDVDRASIRLEAEQLGHGLCGGSAQRDAEVVEVLEVGLVERVADDFDVEVVEVGCGDAFSKVGRQRGLDEHRVVELLHRRGYAERRHGVEYAERVAALEELVGIALVKRTGDEEDDIVDHVGVGHVVQELGERLGGVRAQILELGDELACGLVGDGGSGDGRWFVLEKVAIVGGGELHLEVVERLALGERLVVVGRQERAAALCHCPTAPHAKAQTQQNAAKRRGALTQFEAPS